jgi:hypothetical protein
MTQEGSNVSLITRALSVAAATLSALAFVAPASQAAVSQAGCPAVPLSQSFAAWGDKAFYAAVPGGDFERGSAGWALQGATLVADDGPLTAGARALELRVGTSATSPVFCADKAFPYVRMFGHGSGRLRVEVLHVDGAGRVLDVHSAGNVASDARWAPTDKAGLSGGQVSKYGPLIQLRFTGSRGTVRIDDVLVDPRLSR